jgi:Asp-tRNA(Asn)/Glu-tRNA(Gln) amidotransferase C subunit
MHKNMTDEEIKEAMKQTAKLAGLDLSDERIEADLSSMKRHLDAVDAVAEVNLKLEAEPVPTFRLEKES